MISETEALIPTEQEDPLEARGSATYRLRTEPIPRLLRNYAIPAVVATLVNSLYNIVDRIFIGQGVGSLAISGLAVTFPIQIFLAGFGMLVGVGTSSRLSILLGQKQHAKAENLLGNAFVMSLLLSSTAITLCLIFAEGLLRSFGASDATLPYALEYLNISLPGSIFSNLCFTYNNVMRSSGYPTKAMKTMIIGAALNTLLDPLFIFGFDMGVRGAAIATVISMFVGMCYVMHHFLSRDSLIKLKLHYMRLRWELVSSIVSIGLSPFLVQITGSIVTVFYTNTLVHYAGDYGIAAYGIQNSYAMVLVMVMIGMSQGMQPIVGFNYGAGNYDRMKEAYRLTAGINMVIGAIGAAAAVVAPRIIASLFTSDPLLIDGAARALQLVMWALWAVGYQVTATQYFQSIGYAKRSIFLSLLRQITFLLPLLWILPPLFEIDGIWLTFPIADSMAALVSFMMISKFMRRFV